jgi:hypothetical protein
MSSLAHLCAGGLAVVLLMNYAAVPAAIGPDHAQQSFHGQAPRVLHVVDRSRKGDRLTSTPDNGRSNAQQPVPVEQTRPQPVPRIPVGCDPAFSPLSGASRANFTGRCLAESMPAARIIAALS